MASKFQGVNATDERGRVAVSDETRGGSVPSGSPSPFRPYPKEQQLGPRRVKRYRRRVASPKQWEALRAAKLGPCRICGEQDKTVLELHHVVPRQMWNGDDHADNLVSLCRGCHRGVTMREPAHCRLLLTGLTDDEYAYAVQRAGEDFFDRYYRVEFDRG